MSLRTCFHGKRGRLAKGLVPWRERQYIKDCIFLLPGTICRRGGAFCCYGSTAHRSEPARVAEKGFQRDDSLAGDSGNGVPFPHSPLAQNDLSTPWAALRRPRQYGATLRTRPRGGEGIPKGQLLGGGFEERRPHSRIPLSPRTTCQRRGRPSAAHGSTAHRSKPARRAGKGFQRDWSLWQGVRGTASPEDGGFSRGSIPLKRGFRGTQSH